jgi:hypothetical protein
LLNYKHLRAKTRNFAGENFSGGRLSVIKILLNFKTYVEKNFSFSVINLTRRAVGDFRAGETENFLIARQRENFHD